MFRIASRVGAPILFAVLLTASAAEATQVEALGLPDLIERSDRIVRGRVIAQHALWDAVRRRIYTHSTVIVDDALLERVTRNTPQTLIVRQLGGTVGGITQATDGVGMLVGGTSVVLFLISPDLVGPDPVAKAHDPLHYTVGMAQGRRPVVSRDGEEFLAWDVDGASLVGPRPQTTALRYTDLIDLIRTLR